MRRCFLLMISCVLETPTPPTLAVNPVEVLLLCSHYSGVSANFTQREWLDKVCRNSGGSRSDIHLLNCYILSSSEWCCPPPPPPHTDLPFLIFSDCCVRASDPGVDAACPVHQAPSVPGSCDRLNEEQESKPPEQAAEDRGCHNHKRRHHHKAQDDEGGAAVVVKVTTDGGRGVKDLQKQTEGNVSESNERFGFSRSSLSSVKTQMGRICHWVDIICVCVCVCACELHRFSSGKEVGPRG